MPDSGTVSPGLNSPTVTRRPSTPKDHPHSLWRPIAQGRPTLAVASLYDILHRELGGVQVTKQFAHGRIRADLVVADRVIVELKVNLDGTAKYQRLIGQLEEYREWKGDIVIVLFGRTDPNLRKKLDEQVEKRRGFLLFDQQIRVVQK